MPVASTLLPAADAGRPAPRRSRIAWHKRRSSVLGGITSGWASPIRTKIRVARAGQHAHERIVGRQGRAQHRVGGAGAGHGQPAGFAADRDQHVGQIAAGRRARPLQDQIAARVAAEAEPCRRRRPGRIRAPAERPAARSARCRWPARPPRRDRRCSAPAAAVLSDCAYRARLPSARSRRAGAGQSRGTSGASVESSRS